MNTQIAIRDILPNPFRRIEHYKLNEEKIIALQESFKATGLWPIIIARWQNGTGSKVEIAYGHHRLEAAKRSFGLDGKMGIIVNSVSDEQMLKMMANENLEDWGAEFIVTMETVQATVEAFGEGLIALPEPKQENPMDVRFAPGFMRGSNNRGARHRRYTAPTLARFLGWTSQGGQAKILAALSALEYIETRVLDRAHFIGLTTNQAKAVIKETRVAQERSKDALEGEDLRNLPTQVGAAVSAALKHGKAGTLDARKITDQVTEGKTPKSLPLSSKFINGLCVEISNLIDPEFDKRRTKKLRCVIDSKAYLSAGDVMRVAVVLNDLAERCRVLAHCLAPERTEKALSNNNRLALPA